MTNDGTDLAFMTPIYPLGTKASETPLGVALTLPGDQHQIKYLPKLSVKRNEQVQVPNGPFELFGYPAEQEYRDRGYPAVGMEWKEFKKTKGQFTVYHAQYQSLQISKRAHNALMSYRKLQATSGQNGAAIWASGIVGIHTGGNGSENWGTYL